MDDDSLDVEPPATMDASADTLDDDKLDGGA